ncbi:DUF3316 domain-containing protein [Vibrio ouci]|uniref:DUF3316 domain-containing protein n=1 Tax=Vibrio ouci TaxID=2499078 RepID=A0A4Y8WIY2_9VIBR|nr:DUF3316 domain-containing protein [Vibrio ouci]TFH92653.1 DUF3316 domain-containing protein [Vibrio ouci]
MIKVISFASVMLFSSVAVAGLGGASQTIVSSESMNGDPMGSRDAALAAGKSMIMEINDKSPYELSRSVHYSSNDQVDVNSFELLNSHVTVNEIVTSDGDIAYQPVINVSYEYKARQRD